MSLTGKQRFRSLVLPGLIPVLALLAPVPARPADPAPPPELPGLAITLSPGGVGDGGDPAWIDVTTRISGLAVPDGQPFLRIPVRFAGVPGVAYDAGDMTVTDAAGAVSLEGSVDEPDAGGFLYYRRWTTKRPLQGPITLRYRAPIGDYLPTLGAGPPFDLRAQGGGFSGAGNTFLVLPDTDLPFRIELDWNLDALADGALAVSSFGAGDVRSAGPVDRLVASYFMAGPLGRYPASGGGDEPFSGYWIGTPKFDAAEVLAWSQRAYHAIADFFGADDPPPFRVLMRGNPYPGGGGAALMHSYLLSYPATLTDGDSLHETIAHETVHNWVTSIGGPPGGTSWFSEGMTVAYTRKILLDSGLFTPAEFLQSVNATARSYYTNALNALPNDDIAAGFWRDTRIRSLPYVRGSLYFATVDAQIRDASGGRRSLDDLLHAFVARRERGEAVDADTWRELVTAELGEQGAAGLDAMLAGERIVPPDGAFGPCFHRESATLRGFELGFDPASLAAEPRVVQGLVEGSAAAAAGLENGDRIRQPIALEPVQSDPDKTLELPVMRDGREFTIEYLPRGAAVDGYLWARDTEVPESRCSY